MQNLNDIRNRAREIGAGVGNLSGGTVAPSSTSPQASTPPQPADVPDVQHETPATAPVNPPPAAPAPIIATWASTGAPSFTPPPTIPRPSAQTVPPAQPPSEPTPNPNIFGSTPQGGQPLSQPQPPTGGSGFSAPNLQNPSPGLTPGPQGVFPTDPGPQPAAGKGLDIGTANLVSAIQSPAGIQLNLQRNAFIDVRSDIYMKSMLTKLGVAYAVQGDRLYVLGDASFELANIFGRETRRPMQRGLISPSEVDALPVIRLLIERVIGLPSMPNEPLCFSVPAEPIDSDLNVVYHEGIFKGLLAKLGYAARPIVEGHAVTLAELADESFTGIGISCGGGMFNICVSYKTIPALAFSTSRAGDWVDQNVSAVCGIPASKATLIKEEGIDLMDPHGREQEAVSIYYRNLINYTLMNIKHRFESSEGMPVFPEPITIVCSGGTSLVGNFIECFKDEFQKVNFPIPVQNIRLGDNPLMVVAKGALIAAALGDD